MNYPPNENQIIEGNVTNNEADGGPASPEVSQGGADFVLEEAPENDIIYDNNKEIKETEKTRNISPRLVLVILIILGVATLLFGFISLAHNIKGPFLNNTAETNQTQQTEEESLSEMLAKKNLDTDGDGLSDYDEEYTYKTSPYLADTDSDSYSDKQEIENGYDPLCPAGRDCQGLEETTNTDQNIITPPPGLENLNEEPTAPEEGSGTTELTAEQKEQLKQLTPAEVRRLLLESGQLTEEQLSQITDEQLMQIFLESLK
jgi:hypothetical protein